MKILLVEHNFTSYEFRLLEASGVVEVSKGDSFAYVIRQRGRLLFCSCPGGKYHGKCWHTSIIPTLLQQPEIIEPWVLWAEEVGVEIYVKKGGD